MRTGMSPAGPGIVRSSTGRTAGAAKDPNGPSGELIIWRIVCTSSREASRSGGDTSTIAALTARASSMYSSNSWVRITGYPLGRPR